MAAENVNCGGCGVECDGSVGYEAAFTITRRREQDVDWSNPTELPINLQWYGHCPYTIGDPPEPNVRWNRPFYRDVLGSSRFDNNPDPDRFSQCSAYQRTLFTGRRDWNILTTVSLRKDELEGTTDITANFRVWYYRGTDGYGSNDYPVFNPAGSPYSDVYEDGQLVQRASTITVPTDSIQLPYDIPLQLANRWYWVWWLDEWVHVNEGTGTLRLVSLPADAPECFNIPPDFPPAP